MFSSKNQVAWCQRCGFKYARSTLREDGRKHNLFVCATCWDPDHPLDYAIPARVEGHPRMTPAPPLDEGMDVVLAVVAGGTGTFQLGWTITDFGPDDPSSYELFSRITGTTTWISYGVYPVVRDRFFRTLSNPSSVAVAGAFVDREFKLTVTGMAGRTYDSNVLRVADQLVTSSLLITIADQPFGSAGYMRSRDGGQTWDPPVSVGTEATDPGKLAVSDTGTIVMCSSISPVDRVFWSTDNGATITRATLNGNISFKNEQNMPPWSIVWDNVGKKFIASFNNNGNGTQSPYATSTDGKAWTLSTLKITGAPSQSLKVCDWFDIDTGILYMRYCNNFPATTQTVIGSDGSSYTYSTAASPGFQPESPLHLMYGTVAGGQARYALPTRCVFGGVTYLFLSGDGNGGGTSADGRKVVRPGIPVVAATILTNGKGAICGAFSPTLGVLAIGPEWNGSSGPDTTDKPRYTTDGVTFLDGVEVQGTDTISPLRSMSWSPIAGAFLAFGSATNTFGIWRSSDGINWTRVQYTSNGSIGAYNSSIEVTTYIALSSYTATYGTFDPTYKGGSTTLSNGNRTATGSLAAPATNAKIGGKWYWEMKYVSGAVTGTRFGITDRHRFNFNQNLGFDAWSYGVEWNGTQWLLWNNNASTVLGTGAAGALGKTVNFAVDLTAGKLWAAIDGVWINGDPATGAGGASITTKLAYCPVVTSTTTASVDFTAGTTTVGTPPVGFNRYLFF